MKIAGDVYDSSTTTTDHVLYHPTSLDMIDDILQIVPDICCRLPDSSPDACPSLVVPFAMSYSSSTEVDLALGTCATSAPENLMVAAATDFLMSASDVSISSVSTDSNKEEDIGDFLIDATEWLLWYICFISGEEAW